jgi:hypothetical protein
MVLASDWLPAVFGVVGAVAGVAVSGGITYLLERRRESALIRQAKLLVADELRWAENQLSLLAMHGRSPESFTEGQAGRFLRTAMWHQFKETLALRGAVSKELWTRLSVLVQFVESTRELMLANPDTELSDEQRERFGGIASSIPALYKDLTG